MEGGPCFKNIQLNAAPLAVPGLRLKSDLELRGYRGIQKSETRSFETVTCLGEGGGGTLRGEGGDGTLSKKELKASKRPCSLWKQHQRNEKARRSEGADKRNRPLIKTGAKRKIEEP